MKNILISDVAKKANVSLASVSFAYHNPTRVSEDIREKIYSVARELGYIPKFIQKRSEYGNVGILIDEHRGPFGEFYSIIIQGILREGLRSKWNISIELYDSSDNNTIPPMISEKKVNGVILLSKQEDSFIETLIKKQVPYCVVDYCSDNLKHNYVIPDWYTGAFMATEHLINNGHTKIAMIHSPLEKGKVSRDRIAGYNDALIKHNINFIDGYMLDGHFSYHTSYEVCLDLLKLKPSPTAIFCATDVMALGAYKAIKSLGLKIPNDISIIGFDNIQLPYFMDSLDPPLTTINIDKELLGSLALNIVQDQILHKNFEFSRNKIIPATLIKKSSVQKLS